MNCQKSRLKGLVYFVLVPALFYLAWFLLLTFPHMRLFTSHLWAGPGDGLSIYWNIWWVDKAITDLHTHPWFTPYLFHPWGTDLFVHTMHPLKGFMAIPLLRIMPGIVCYNTLLTLSFVFTGVSAFWLSHAFTKSYGPSLFGGFIYTFCNFHFAHAQGHLHLISLEWIPVFVLLWHMFLMRPRMLLAAGSALALLLVFLCDAYYFMYCVLAGGLMVLWHCYRRRDLFFILKRDFRLPLAVFLALTLATCGVLAGAIVHSIHSDPPPTFPGWDFSMDLLAPIIPGGHWRFANLTESFWSRIPGKIHGNSVHFGTAVIALLIYGLYCRKKLLQPHLMMWYGVGLFFGIMALGPNLFIWGWKVPYIGDPEYPLLRMPYVLLNKMIPGLIVGARPNRMIIMTILCVAVIAAIVLKQVLRERPWGRSAAAVILLLVLVEYLPSPLPAFDPAVPEYVRILKHEEGGGAVYDIHTFLPTRMYYQTIHERPIPSGWTSRVSFTLREKREAQEDAYREHRYEDLRDRFDFRFLVVPRERSSDVWAACPGARQLYEDDEILVVDLGDRKSGMEKGDSHDT